MLQNIVIFIYGDYTYLSKSDCSEYKDESASMKLKDTVISSTSKNTKLVPI